MIDINILPQKAQNELIDFYQFLVDRYASRKTKKKKTNHSASDEVDAFFNRFEIDLSDFRFNRNDLYER